MKAILPITAFLLTTMAGAEPMQKTLEPSAAKSVVQHLIADLDVYIFPDKANVLRAYLLQHMDAYQATTTPEALAAKLTSDMRAVANDKHLAVSYSAQPSPREASPSGPDNQKMHRVEEARGFGIQSVARLPGNVGLIDIRYFSDDPEAFAAMDGAMRLLHGSDALIIDLRRNMGGHPKMVERLLTYLFADQVQLTSIVWREAGKERTEEQWTLVYVPGERFASTPVFVLTSAGTFSAGEQLAYDLKTLRRATLIGHATGGGANPAAATQPLGSGFDAFIPTGRAFNPITKTNWESVGVQPDVETKFADALLEAYTRALKAAKPVVSESRLDRARERAISDPGQALRDAGLISD
jgi:hypothetical protein